MATLSFARSKTVRAITLSSLLAALALACAQNGPPRQPAAGTAATAQPSAPTPAASGDATAAAPKPGETAAPAAAPKAAEPPAFVPPQPKDGKWLVDEEGSKYFLEPLSKKLKYLRTGPDTIRTTWGIEVQVADEDDDFFYYKVYEVTAGRGPVVRQKPTPEQLEEAAATYAVKSSETDRLHLSSYGNGLPETGQWRNGFDLADVNGDGILDIVHGPARKQSQRPVVFLGDGKGGWRRWAEASYPQVSFDYGDVATADFNGDGNTDMAFAMHLRGLQVLLGDGKGGFTNSSRGLDFSVPGQGGDASGFSSRTIAAVDWNHDGRPDILALGEGPRFNLSSGKTADGPPPGASSSYGAVVYLNQADGSWKRIDQGTGNGNIFGDAVAVADFNADGRPDFATGSSVMGRSDLVNLGRSDGGWDAMPVEPMRPSAFIRAVAAGDFDRDGRPDLAVSYSATELGIWRSGIDVFLSRPSNAWERRPAFVREGKNAIFALDAGDLDGDGNVDFVGLDNTGATLIFLGDGKGSFAREKEDLPAVDGCRGYHVRVADLDGDGRPEVIAAFAGEPGTVIPGIPIPPKSQCESNGAMVAWHVVTEKSAKAP